MRLTSTVSAALAASLLAAATGPAQAGLLDLLFGPSPRPAPSYGFAPPFEEAPRAPRPAVHAGGSRSICVRLCDGYYYPLDSVATHGGSSLSDCEQSCPGTAMDVFRVSGDAIAEARGSSGRRYGDLENAFSYRTSVSNACTCHRAPATAASIMGDMTLRNGDIVVTSKGASVFRGDDRDLHAPSDFEDIRASRAVPRGTFALADRVLGFSFQEGLERKFAVQLSQKPPPSGDIVVTPLRTGTISPTAQAEARATPLPGAAAAAARVVLPRPAGSQD